ncbi:hypothetical protein [Sandaracinus amylolyticus]|uniref:hypothetical protein n=1 Tax=Sandaracinus amylolyticus TaxID=927083 RepID=UPI001F412B1E|nr:hypothetical protein [Sandaracinus amylolyticus]UJR78375.1 Hypothetical protein I5071_4020 [Sandaracinus amylolyticus]
MTKNRRRALSVLIVAVFAVLGTATAGGGEEGAASSGSNDAVNAMEGHFQYGQAWGEGPEAQQMAQTLLSDLEPGDSVAVRVIDGTPRRVVALVKYGDAQTEGLADLDDATRRQHLDGLLSDLDAIYETGDSNVGLGIRGTLFYGAVVTRQPGQAPQYQVGAIITTDPLEAILDAAATPPAPPRAIAVGATESGQLQASPAPLPRYLLTLAAPANLMTNVVSPGLTGEQAPFAMICTGAVRFPACETAMVEPQFDDQGNPVYRLAAGAYSVFVVPGDDCGGSPVCPPAQAGYQLTVTQM